MCPLLLRITGTDQMVCTAVPAFPTANSRLLVVIAIPW